MERVSFDRGKEEEVEEEEEEEDFFKIEFHLFFWRAMDFKRQSFFFPLGIGSIFLFV